MIPANNEEAIFKVLRELPTEMSEGEVAKLLEGLPTVATKHWFYRFHLNTLLPIIGLIGLLVSGHFWMNNQDTLALDHLPNTSVEIEADCEVDEEEKLEKINKEVSTKLITVTPKNNFKKPEKASPHKKSISEPELTNVDKKSNIENEATELISIRSELEKVLQKSLDSNHLERILEKETNGDFRPLTLVTNHHFFQKVDLELTGKKINIVYSKDTAEIDGSYLGITNLDIKKEDAIFEFQYKGALVSIALAKKNNEWLYRSIHIKDQLISEKKS